MLSVNIVNCVGQEKHTLIVVTCSKAAKQVQRETKNTVGNSEEK